MINRLERESHPNVHPSGVTHYRYLQCSEAVNNPVFISLKALML